MKKYIFCYWFTNDMHDGLFDLIFFTDVSNFNLSGCQLTKQQVLE
jgi:hypothetical protein